MPHGGYVLPEDALERRGHRVISEPDVMTIELADELEEAFAQLTGTRLHVIYCHLSRHCVDVNRSEEETPFADKCRQSRDAYFAYHGFIDSSISMIELNFV